MSETEITPESSDASQLPGATKPARRGRASRARRENASDVGASADSAAAEIETAPLPAPESGMAAARSSNAAGEGETPVESSDPSAERVIPTEPDAESDDVEFPPLPDHEVDRAVEALLFASAEPLTPQRVAAVLRVTQRRVKTAIDRLREEYAATQRAFDIREIAGGLRLYTRSDFDDLVARLEKVKPPEKLSASALESLAIVSYRQPITRAEIDSIRGVQSSALLKSLTDRKLIRVVGRSEQPGRPLQYGTTKRFLDHFGLASIEDLPRVEDLKAP